MHALPGLNAEARAAEQALFALADAGKAKTAARYFQSAPGQYGEGDLFLGIRVPVIRETARQFNTLTLDEFLTWGAKLKLNLEDDLDMVQ